ncbi:hypothetical protein ACFX2U_09715 [Gilliamella apicola]|uniref:hypothetical protein n=1 Tax=Gilliamella apicola TaxID=1196095 RepID=UPI003986FA27
MKRIALLGLVCFALSGCGDDGGGKVTNEFWLVSGTAFIKNIKVAMILNLKNIVITLNRVANK